MENSIIFDWVTITYKKHTVWQVIDMLGLKEIEYMDMNGRYGYRESKYSGGISVMSNGAQPGMGVCLEMSGKGCRIFEKYGNGDYSKLLAMCLDNENHMKLTRLDVAYDDYCGILDIDRICDDTRQCNLVTRFHQNSWQTIYSGRGNSIILGSRKSDMLVRIYDKNKEQNEKEKRHWVRCEMQLRRERALGFVEEMQVRNIGQVYKGVMSNYIRFVIPGNDTNKRRWDTADFWVEFLSEAEAISIYKKLEEEYTYDKLEAYVISCSGNAIACYIDLVGINNFVENLNERTQKPNKKYQELKDKVINSDPIKKVVLTDKQKYDIGLSEVQNKVFGIYDDIDIYTCKIKDPDKCRYEIIKDMSGVRWFKCIDCGEIKREDESLYIGDVTGINYGQCKICA